MKDPILLDAFYWLFMNRDFVLITASTFTLLSLVLVLALIIKKWGESY